MRPQKKGLTDVITNRKNVGNSESGDGKPVGYLLCIILEEVIIEMKLTEKSKAKP